jgi:hypothetical protein
MRLLDAVTDCAIRRYWCAQPAEWSFAGVLAGQLHLARVVLTILAAQTVLLLNLLLDISAHGAPGDGTPLSCLGTTTLAWTAKLYD